MNLIVVFIAVMISQTNCFKVEAEVNAFMLLLKNRSCGRLIREGLNSCHSIASKQLKNIKDTDSKILCCTAWDLSDCVNKNIKICAEKDRKIIEIDIKVAQNAMEQNLCQNYHKNSGKCNSGSSVIIKNYFIFSLISLVFVLNVILLDDMCFL
jgi:hypothetical protein